MESPDISIIIPTYNGGRTLERCLSSVLFLTGCRYEILVIDNCSTDNTTGITREYVRRYPRILRYLTESSPGLSYARNHGIRAARGRILLFIDDDAVADTNMLTALRKTFARYRPACVGGKVLPHPSVSLPQWLTSEAGGYLGLFRYGDTPCELPAPLHPIGCNMAFTKSLFGTVGYFAHGFDRIKSSLLSGGETEFCGRIRQHGQKIFYDPRIVVYHLLKPERLTKRYLFRRYFMEGVTRIRLGQEDSRPLFHAAVAVVQASRFLIRHDWTNAFKAGYELGALKELLIYRKRL